MAGLHCHFPIFPCITQTFRPWHCRIHPVTIKMPLPECLMTSITECHTCQEPPFFSLHFIEYSAVFKSLLFCYFQPKKKKKIPTWCNLYALHKPIITTLIFHKSSLLCSIPATNIKHFTPLPMLQWSYSPITCFANNIDFTLLLSITNLTTPFQ